MFSATVTVVNETGLHARPASELAELSQKFESDITILSGDDEVNPKSIISILSAGIAQGTKIELKVEGPDEEQAGKELVDFIEALTE